MNAPTPHKWWFTLISAVFGFSSSLPLFGGEGDGLFSESAGKDDLLSDHFDGNSPGSLLSSLTCHPSPRLTSFAFRSNEGRRLSLDWDPYGGTDPLGMFPLFREHQC